MHVNIPLTLNISSYAQRIALVPEGPSPVIITVPVGSSVEWLSTLSVGAAITDLMRLTDNPVVRPLSTRDPLTDTLGFDGVMLAPGQVYRRQFSAPGVYVYTDGAGHTGQIVVQTSGRVYLPVVICH